MSRVGVALLLAVLVGASLGVFVLTRLSYEPQVPSQPAAEEDRATGGQGDEPLLSLHVPPGATPRFERVVLVTIDTLRADHLASYGYFRETSPFLDRLAERSVRFTHALTASSHTGPSHATMLTGLPPQLHGMQTNGGRLDARIETMAQLLSSAGFESAAFTSVAFLEGIANGFGSVRARTSMADAIANAAISWMRRERDSARFFLWLHFYDPHRWKLEERLPREHLAALLARSELDDAEAYRRVAELHGLPQPFEPLEWRSGDKGGEHMRPQTRREVLDYIDATTPRSPSSTPSWSGCTPPSRRSTSPGRRCGSSPRTTARASAATTTPGTAGRSTTSSCASR